MPRFIGRGKEGVFFVPSLADPNSASAAAVAAGTPLHNILRSFTGFTSNIENVDNADYGSRVNKTLPGAENLDDSSLTIFAGDADTDAGEAARTALAEGTNGFIVWVKRSQTPATGQRYDAFPVRVGGQNDDRTFDMAVRTWTASMSITDAPSKNKTMVA